MMENIHRSRQRKRSFFSLNNGSFLTFLVLVILATGAGLYLKNILSHSTAIKKVIVGDKVYYSYGKEEEAERLAKEVK